MHFLLEAMPLLLDVTSTCSDQQKAPHSSPSGETGRWPSPKHQLSWPMADGPGLFTAFAKRVKCTRAKQLVSGSPVAGASAWALQPSVCSRLLSSRPTRVTE